MAENSTQSFANHARLHPPFHFFLTALVLASFVLSVMACVHHPSSATSALILLTIALFLNSAITRTYSLKVQDRVIRLEERLRLAKLLPEAIRPRIEELTPSQLIALRFASDAELPALALRAMNEGLTSKQIKAAIQSWRADTFRV